MKAVLTILAAAVFVPAAAASAAPSVPAAAPAPATNGVARGAVTGISVVPADGQTAVVVSVDGAVQVRDFTLASPNRVVLDLTGASLAVPAAPYDRVARGGVVNVRAANFKAGTVRVVVELDGRRKYDVQRVGNDVRVVLSGSSVAFAPWSVGRPSAAPSTTVAAASPTAQPAAKPAGASTTAAAEVPTAPSLDDAMPMTAAWTTSSASPAAQPANQKTVVREAPLPVAQTASSEPLLPRELSQRAPAREPARDAAREPVRERPAAARTTARRTQPRVTVTYQDADIRDVVGSFASFSGRTIVVGKDVNGTVTAEVKDQPWDIALRALLSAQGLAATEDRDGIITVDSYKNITSNQASEPLVTQTVELNYAKAGALAPILQGLLSRDCGPVGGGGGGGGGQNGVPMGCVVRGAVAVDTSTNKLLITDAPSRIPEIIARIRELDIRTPQVAIKAKIVFVDRTGLLDLGVTYDLGQGSKAYFNTVVNRGDPQNPGSPDPAAFRVAIGGNALAAISNAGNQLKPGALNVLYSASIGGFQLSSFVNALQQTSLADVQSEPSIVTLNNKTAEIFVGQQVPIRVIDASAGSGAGQAPRATVRLQEAGIRLAVTPQVTNNRKIMLTLRAENSQPRVGPSDVGFYFDQQRADNQVLVSDGETAVIGGLTITSNTKIKSGIPFLVDLPLLGRLFGQHTTQEQKRDLLILVTPQILDEGEQAPIAPPRR